MRKPGKRGTVVAVLACAGVLGPAAIALGADTITASTTLDYDLPTFNMNQGETPTFMTTDSPDNPHNVTARGKIGGRPLFITKNIIGPNSTPVNGAKYLSQGNYAFFCSVHPDMQATLAVSGAGTPVARPTISVKVLSRNIDKVAGSRKAKVRVKATTDSDDVSLKLKLKNLVLGSKANIDLDAGQTRTLKLKLTKKAKNKLRKRAKAKVKLFGSVPFGAGDTGTKVLK